MSALRTTTARRIATALPFVAAAAVISVGVLVVFWAARLGSVRLVIPPGQEDVIADMVARGVLLPGGCRLVEGGIDGDGVRVSYRCDDGKAFSFELRHPGNAPSDAPRTTRFALVGVAGSPSSEFIDALLARIRTHENDFGWQASEAGPVALTGPAAVRLLLLVVTALVLTIIGRSDAGIIAPRWFASRRSNQAGVAPGAIRALAAIRLAGLAAVVAIASRAAGGHPGAGVETLVGVLWIAAFLWLTVSGFFGYGDARRSDVIAVVPFILALVVREMFTLHSVQALELEFASGLWDRHSVLYPLLQTFFVPIVRDTHAFTMHLNGVLGALAALPLYLFVRQRTGSRAAGVSCASLLAVHPLIARFAPTDGTYSLLLATWFGGLALLTARRPGARALLGGATLLAIAGTSRVEGVTVLLASLLLVDVVGLVAAARRHIAVATASVIIMALLGALQAAALVPYYAGSAAAAQLIPPAELLWATAVSPAAYNDPVFMRFVLFGAFVGLLPRMRLGLLAYLAMLIVLAPCADSEYGVIAFHRLVPACAVQTIVAGMGAYGLVAWLPRRTPWRYLKGLPVLLAVYVFVQHAPELQTRYAFTEEYDIVRSNLVSNGVPPTDCSLLTFTSLLSQDADLHDFSQVVPGMPTVDCVHRDCVREVAESRCAYYVRSAACYFRERGPETCVDDCGVNAPCAAFESAVELEPVDVRDVDLDRTFPNTNYPRSAPVGLFRVRAKPSS